MKKNIINQAGNWSAWSEEKKHQLEQGRNNTEVGEKIVFQNEEFRVWSIHLPANQSLPFHKHCKRYFWTALTSGKSRSYYHDGTISETEYETGATLYFEDLNDENYFVHNLENIGETTLIFTTVEFLD